MVTDQFTEGVKSSFLLRASQLGRAAVLALIDDAAPCMVGIEEGRIVRHPLVDAWTRKKELDQILWISSLLWDNIQRNKFFHCEIDIVNR